jgi:hypothetical protein
MYIKTIDLWQSVLNIIAVFEYQMGSESYDPSWYQREGEELRKTAIELGYNPEVYTYAIAAFSPAVPWDKNKTEVFRMAKAMKENRSYIVTPAQKFVGYGTNVVKTFNILLTGDTSHCRGEKVESFARNLLGADGVTIDRHAVHIAQNGLWANIAPSGKKRLAPGMYGEYAQTYVLATNIVNRKHGLHLTASQVQAITWTYCATKGV